MERSPYLLQHAHNPVDWFPWEDEAFKKAEAENKLIFLSIGYSTCHWCHVMEKESFEDEEVAQLMNRVFVSIKVDREERPDLDSVYMDIAMLLNKRGGWPLNLILTPGRKPFYAATYIPKDSSASGGGMLKLIPKVQSVWKDRPEEVQAAAENILQALKNNNMETQNNLPVKLSGQQFDSIKAAAFNDLKKRYDAKYGGFNLQPKFPQPQNLLFLLRHYKNTDDSLSLTMVENTLLKMRAGGIYDHIGYGFHRYSTDRQWTLPHFEKMLYDQAMLILAYTETWQLTGNRSFRQTAEDVIEYVLRDMRSPEGGFYSAEDADSEGEEGKFYLWDYNEFANLIGRSGLDAEKYAGLFNMKDGGNYTDEASGRKPGDNILFLDPEKNNGAPEADYEAVRSLLFKEREGRVHPHKDDKILTDWNGLMIFALARAAWIFDEPKYYEAAETAARFLLNEMKGPDGSLLHSYRLGESGTLGMIDDYAFFIRGLLELYRAGFKTSYVEQAALLTEYAGNHFEDNTNGGYFQSDSLQTDLLIRKKSMMDNAVPSGNSLMFENLMQLFKLTGRAEYRAAAEGILRTLGDELSSYPSAFTTLLSALDYSGKDGREIVVVGEPDAAAEFIKEINSRFQSGTVVLLKTPETAVALKKLASYTAYYSLPEGRKAAVYVCTDFTCKAPVFTVEDLR